MSVRRALVDCAVLSLQDTCVFYPSCKGCFSRADVEQQDTTRCRCSKCGYSCLRDQVDYRYRLALRVTRDRCIFGVTVFGACLSPFFGIHASGLQRLVENSEGASTKSTLLVKAVEDCFIGRHFTFSIKLTGTESGPWVGGPVANGSSSKEAVHFIASQMFLPKAPGPVGCTVVSYYRILLQKAAEYELQTSRPPAATLLLIPHHFPASIFSDATLSTSGLLSPSPQSSPYQDGSLTPTPPWQQSLGLITSSAEQEEGCSTRDSRDDNSSPTDDINKTPHRGRGCLQKHEVAEERTRSPPLSFECSSSSSPPFAKYPCSVGNTPILNTWFSPPSPGHSSSKTRPLAKTFLSSSLVWEDLPFSESLTEFFCEENNDFDIVGEAEPHLSVQNRKKSARNNLEISSQDKNVSRKSTSVCQSNTQVTDSHSRILLDIVNTPAPSDGHDASDEGHKNRSPARSICSREWNQEDGKTSFLKFYEDEEEQLEGDSYNCSADLFSSSLIIDMNTKKLDTPAETAGTTTETCPLQSENARQSENDSTPDKQMPKSKKCMNRISLIPTNLDFVPPSQSTPVVKVADRRQDSRAFHENLPESDKSNRVGANQLSQRGRESAKENAVQRTTSGRRSRIFTPKSRFWKPHKHKNHLLTQQHPRVRRGALNTGRIDHKCDSSDATVDDYEDSEVIVPPTPAAETRSVKLGRRRPAGGGGSNSGPCEGQLGDGVKRTLLDKTLTSSRRSPTPTGNCDSETVDVGTLGGSNCHLGDDDNEACDWSRDLFSDSI